MSRLTSKKTRLREQKDDEINIFVNEYNKSMEYWCIKSKVTTEYINDLVGYGPPI